jgi:hypothetical protein
MNEVMGIKEANNLNKESQLSWLIAEKSLGEMIIQSYALISPLN